MVGATLWTINAGSTLGTVAVPVNDDNYSEPDENYTVTLSTPANATLGTTSVHTATIQDNDGTPDLDFASAAGSNHKAEVLIKASTEKKLLVKTTPGNKRSLHRTNN